MVSFCADSWFCTKKNACKCMSVWVCMGVLYCYTPRLCACVYVCLLPFIGNSEPLYFLLLSHFLINILLPLLLFSPSFSRSLGHQNEVFYLCSTTHYWRPGWLAGRLEFCWDSVSCVWCSKETATARWLQTALLLFVFNLYSATLGWQGPAPHSGVVQYNHSLWHRAI